MDTMPQTLNSICVFCGSRSGANPHYAEVARELGRELADRKISLVYGGGNVGLMGEIADAVLSHGGVAIGVIPNFLLQKELGHPELTQLHIVQTMHQRKEMMADLSDAFIALPGGMGTLEEMCEILTWAQLGLHTKPFGLLNAADYYVPLMRVFDQMVTEQFLTAKHRNLLVSADDPRKLLAEMERYVPPTVEKWLDRQAT